MSQLGCANMQTKSLIKKELPPRFPAEVEEVLARLLNARIRVHVVGGALRDMLLGREARDFDLVIESPLSEAARFLPKTVQVSVHRPVLLFPRRDDGPRIEITALRNAAHSLEEDLRFRDFTLNAIAFDPRERRYVDPLGGRSDLRSGLLRAVEPERTFRDDAVRIMRGIRLALELDLDTDASTVRGMQRDAWRLHHSPPERVRDELFRLLQQDPPSLGIRQMRWVGALAAVLPELLRGVGIGQNRQHLKDVFDHTLDVCDRVRADPVLRLAVLLHDVGKAESKCFREKRMDFSFLRHEFLGVAHVRRVATRLRLSKRVTNRIERLVQHHLLFPDRLQRDAAIRRMLRRTGRDILTDLLELRRADLASGDPQGSVPKDWKVVEARIQELAQGTEEPGARLAIGGKEVMQMLGIPEGPEVGRWLQRARRHVMDRPEENERQRLLAWLREAGGEQER
jgi:tRNA nucleotidyltransferase (CCA-adding enzyme)